MVAGATNGNEGQTVMHLHAHLCAPSCISVHTSMHLCVPPYNSMHTFKLLCAHLYVPPCTSVYLCAHLHVPLCTPPHTSVHKSDCLSVPTKANQIISIDQPNYHKILIFSPSPLKKGYIQPE